MNGEDNMKVYLKSGQMVELNDVHTVVVNNTSFGVGKLYEKDVDDKYISPLNVFRLCKDHKNKLVTFCFGFCDGFDTMTDEIAAVMCGEEE